METKQLEDIIHLLQDVQWLFNFPVTQIFTRDVFSQMPVDWKEALTDIPLDSLNGIAQGVSQEHWPSSLQCFLEKCRRLSIMNLSSDCQTHPPDGHTTGKDLQIPQEFAHGVTPKKMHEITALTNMVKKVLAITGSNHILDVGSGRGYIDSFLHKMLPVSIIGVEGSDKLVKSAEKRHSELFGQCSGISFRKWTLSDSQGTLHEVRQIVSDLTKGDVLCPCQAKTLDKSGGYRTCQLSAGVDNEKGSVNLAGQGDHQTATDCAETHSKSTCTLLGLHACADLSPIMMKMFKECSQISSLILLSCCYHKMNRPEADKAEPPTLGTEDCGPRDCDCSGSCVATSTNPIEKEVLMNRSSFLNFPMSESLQEIVRQNNFEMSVFGLRLGAQESGQKWCAQVIEDHEYHMKNVAYRGILEAACVKEGFTLKKLRRRCVRKSSFRNFSEYKENIFENYVFEKRSSSKVSAKLCDKKGNSLDSGHGEVFRDTTYISSALDSCYDNYEHYFPLIEPLTGLQLALQPVIEALVLLDRVVYLKECNFTQVWLEKVFDVEISPRNVALVAVQ